MSYPASVNLGQQVSNAIQRTTPDYTGAIAITPSDSNVIGTPEFVRALMVGATGDVKLTMADRSVVTLNLIAGTIYPLVVSQVWASGTTATGITGLY